MDTSKRCEVGHLKLITRRTTTIIAHDVHAQESRKGGKDGNTKPPPHKVSLISRTQSTKHTEPTIGDQENA